MTAPVVGKTWDWGQNKEIRRPIPGKGKKGRDHRKIATESGRFGFIERWPIKMFGFEALWQICLKTRRPHSTRTVGIPWRAQGQNRDLDGKKESKAEE
jgi:hypothetical protein